LGFKFNFHILVGGYILGFVVGWGGTGLWLGQSIGLAIAAILFLTKPNVLH
jgi:MATE family multidrug resistance protein